MPDMLKLAAIAVTAALCAVVVRKSAAELAAAIALAAGAILLGSVLSALEGVRAFMDELADLAGLSPALLAPVLKTVGISILTRFAAALCRDAGEGGIAAFVETAGAVSALLVSLPLLRTVLDMVGEFL
ncbi:MAG TPA: stage III sporulation AC/AD family protein [Candidatus Intestinimonas stercoravium]|nr:stage III sporulation AC/AD family protein [Candidatus Intestinimonas stercoravium]